MVRAMDMGVGEQYRTGSSALHMVRAVDMGVRQQLCTGSSDAGHMDISPTSMPHKLIQSLVQTPTCLQRSWNECSWTRMAGARDTRRGEKETGESCMVCQTFASLFQLWILFGDALSTLQPSRLKIPCFPLQPVDRHTPMHTSGLLPA